MTRVLIAGLGNMGLSHALAHHNHPDAEIVGLVNRSEVDWIEPELQGYPFYSAHSKTAWPRRNPIWSSSPPILTRHADYACAAMEAGAHVFVEKPLAMTVADAERVVVDGQAHAAQAGGWLYPAAPPVLDALDLRGARTWWTVCFPAEPESAVVGS